MDIRESLLVHYPALPSFPCGVLLTVSTTKRYQEQQAKGKQT